MSTFPTSHKFFASQKRASINYPQSKRHKSGSSQRSKTARNKKKKAWSQLSRWSVDVSDDELDFLRFCQTRGITRATSAPLMKRQASTSLIGENKEGRSKKPLPVREMQTVDIAKENSRYRDSLCSFLHDKEKFIAQSEFDYVEITTSSQKKVDLKTSSQASQQIKIQNNENKEELPKSSEQVKEVAKSLPEDGARVLSNSKLKKSGSEKLLEVEVEETNKKHQTSISNKSAAENSWSSSNCSSPDSVVSAAPGSISTQSTKSHQTASQRRAPRQWTAEVENEIMKIYEEGAPGAGLAALDSKPQPLRVAVVRDQLDARAVNPDHTPSYVLALANLFRRRMQLRKEFSQVYGNINESSTNEMSTSSARYHNNAFPQHSTKAPLTKQPHHVNDSPSVSLRYHHLSTENGVTVSPSVAGTTKQEARQSSVSFCSIASPISAKQIASVYQNAVISRSINMPPDKAVSANCKTTKGSLVESKCTPYAITGPGYPLPGDCNKLPKLKSLDALLTVFAKPPKFKFTELHSASKEINETDEVKFNKNDVADDVINKENVSERRNSVVSGKSRRNVKSNNSKETKPSCFKQQSEMPSVAVSMTSQEQIMRSDEQSYEKSVKSVDRINASNGISTTALGKTQNLSPTESSKAVFFDKNLPLDGDIAMLPMSRVRWSTSLGSLYKKTNIFPEPKQQFEKNIPSKLSVNKMSSVRASFPVSMPLDKKLSKECVDQTGLMSVSPIEKPSAFAR